VHWIGGKGARLPATLALRFVLVSSCQIDQNPAFHITIRYQYFIPVQSDQKVSRIFARSSLSFYNFMIFLLRFCGSIQAWCLGQLVTVDLKIEPVILEKLVHRDRHPQNAVARRNFYPFVQKIFSVSISLRRDPILFPCLSRSSIRSNLIRLRSPVLDSPLISRDNSSDSEYGRSP
jgi:hypothetical protein